MAESPRVVICAHCAPHYPLQVVSSDDIRQAVKELKYFGENLSPDVLKIKPRDLAHITKVRVQQNGEEIESLVTAAWQADWNTVFSLLESNPYIINCIPSGRAWAVLHQAAWFNDLEVTRKLLKIPTCDPFIRTKQTRDNSTKPRSTAATITEHAKIVEIIKEAQEKKKEDFKVMEVPSFIEAEYETELEIRSVLLVIASFRNCIYPEIIESDASLVYSQIMHDVFEYIDTGEQWKKARRCIGQQVQVLGTDIANYLVTGDCNGDINSDNKEEKEEFYKRIIRMYTSTSLSIAEGNTQTSDSKLFHNCLNRNLRTEGIVAKPTLGEDLAYAAFGILLNAILMNWPGLKRINQGKLYRGLTLEKQQYEMYKEKTQFVWLNLTSTSLNAAVAEFFTGNVCFVIESTDGKYTGKQIEGISDEEEVLFPSGAKFEVTKVEELPKTRKIWIRLIDYSPPINLVSKKRPL